MTGMEPALMMAAVSTAKTIMDEKAQRKAGKAQERELSRTRAIEERKKKDALDRAKATARARFAVRGVSAKGGSAGALLRGLEQDHQMDMDDGRAALDLRLDTVRAERSRATRRNLLQLANTAASLK